MPQHNTIILLKENKENKKFDVTVILKKDWDKLSKSKTEIEIIRKSELVIFSDFSENTHLPFILELKSHRIKTNGNSLGLKFQIEKSIILQTFKKILGNDLNKESTSKYLKEYY